MAACFARVLVLGLAIGVKTMADQSPAVEPRNSHSNSPLLPNSYFWM